MTAWCQERKFASLQHFVMEFEGGNYRQFFLSACPALENRRRPGASPDPPLSKNLNQCMTKTWLHDWPSTPTKILKLKGETIANFFQCMFILSETTSAPRPPCKRPSGGLSSGRAGRVVM